MSTEVAQQPQSKQQATRMHYRRPVYQVRETTDAFVVSVQVPGVTREGIHLSLEEDTLTLTAERGALSMEGQRLVRSEIPAGDFRLVLSLNVRIQADAIQAAVKDGVLTLTLPKAEETKPRQIEIR